jgi:multidrug efflux pump subunit AcrB
MNLKQVLGYGILSVPFVLLVLGLFLTEGWRKGLTILLVASTAVVCILVGTWLLNS